MEKILNFSVSGQVITLENAVPLVAGSVDYLYCNFIYADDWAGINKEYRFLHKGPYGTTRVSAVCGENGLVRVPHEVIKPPYFEVAVGGYENGGSGFIPTLSVRVLVSENRYGDADEVLEGEEEPTPGAVAQMLSYAEDCKNAANEAVGYAKKAPYIGENGNWLVYDAEAGEYIDTGEPSQGAQGEKGDKGEQGEPGKSGAAGEPGAPGADGVTPHIGDNGNWFIGDNDTRMPSRGEGVKNTYQYYGFNAIPMPEDVFDWEVDEEKNSATLLFYARGTEKNVVVPYEYNGVPVKVIGYQAFSCQDINHITLPRGVEEIGAEAFVGYVDDEMTLPETVKLIGDYAFAGVIDETAVITILSKDAEFGSEVFADSPNVTLRCYKGSTAEAYALENSFKIEYIIDEDYVKSEATARATEAKQWAGEAKEAAEGAVQKEEGYGLCNIKRLSVADFGNIITHDILMQDGTISAITLYTKVGVDNLIGDIETALDNIIAMQNSLIGGEAV